MDQATPDRAEDWSDASITMFDTEVSRNARQKTFVIFGSPRGGTTAVAGCVRTMGIFLGDHLPRNLEDRELVLKARDKAAAVARRNATHDVWGWKYPSITRYLPDLLDDLRNPRFICVTRDVTANTSAKLKRHPQLEKGQTLLNTYRSVKANMDLIFDRECPTLFISYEKLLLNPDAAIADLAGFLAVPVPVEARERALNFIEPGRYQPVKASDG